jgi:3-oxoacyl-[acyl-carrier-protein] synthase-3
MSTTQTFKNPRAKHGFQGRTCSIISVGSYVPERILTNAELEKMVDTTDEWITSRTGIKERHLAAENEFTSDMAAAAAQRAMDKAGITADQIDLIIVATITPDMLFPSTAALVQNKLGARKAAAFDIEAACSGFIYALEIGQQFIMTRTYETVLVIGAERLSSIVNWKDRNTCVLFGDGGCQCQATGLCAWPAGTGRRLCQHPVAAGGASEDTIVAVERRDLRAPWR